MTPKGYQLSQISFDRNTSHNCGGGRVLKDEVYPRSNFRELPNDKLGLGTSDNSRGTLSECPHPAL